ncbi:MAG TPA: serine/threonine-protein kinase [Polyangiaceae bacterium]|nr:serine/threonine-protein kinase [Polyangiaceae bacterium]
MGKKDRFGLVGNTIASTFRVDEVVAEGGFGVVYRAFHLHFRAPIALKCLKIPADLSTDERATFLEQFRSEAEILFRLSTSQPNIVRPLHVDAVQSPGGEFVPVLALEWLEGRSFERIIEERACAAQPALGLDELVEWLTPVAAALDRAHEFPGPHGETLSVIHRDIKPDNLFLCTVDGQSMVKILDFGISKMRRSAEKLAGHFSRTDGQAPFSPAYGAPEQWVPKRYGQTGPWTDVWGLALTVVEIIKGDAVINGDHQAMMGTTLDPQKRPTPRNEGVEVADDVELVFKKALAVDPRYRYQRVRDFWDALRAAMHLGGSSSQSRIRVEQRFTGLPPMSAPTPWTPPNTPPPPEVKAAGVPGLPPMLGPAPLEVSVPTDPSVDPYYPSDPEAGLAPVHPAPAVHTDDPLDIPPLASHFGGNARRRRTDPRRIASSPATASATTPATPPASPAPLKIELQPTSIFPPPAEDDEEEPEPLSLVPPSWGRRQQR